MPKNRSNPNMADGKIHFVQLLTVDIDGEPKGMTVPIKPVDSITPLKSGAVTIPGSGIDGSSVKGLATISESDLRLTPDLNTIRELPGSSPRRAVVIADIHKRGTEGRLSPYPFASRMILKHNVEKLVTQGYRLKVKLEPEFYFLTSDGEPLDEGRYADVFPKNQGADLLLEIGLDLRTAGIETRWLHSEHGKGQQEIELDFEEVSIAADNLTLFKLLLRRRAALYGVEVNFMPKPFPNQAGSGLHCHLQLWKGNRNIFGTSKGELTKSGLQFIAGLIAHAPAITAIANPSINSFKRLVPGFEAPVHISWGYLNRSAMIRVPLFTKTSEAAVEFRSPDPLANPYLLLAVLLGAGMDGINQKLEPPKPVSEDVYHLTSERLAQLNIQQLPDTLHGALRSLQLDKVIQSVLGEDFSARYQEIRKAEWYDYTHRQVTDVEWEWYLSR